MARFRNDLGKADGGKGPRLKNSQNAARFDDGGEMHDGLTWLRQHAWWRLNKGVREQQKKKEQREKKRVRGKEEKEREKRRETKKEKRGARGEENKPRIFFSFNLFNLNYFNYKTKIIYLNF